VHVLTTQRLTLRRLCVDDAAFMLGLLNQPSWLRFIGDRGVSTLQQARAYITNGALQSYARFGFGFYLVERQALLPQYWSQGLAHEAAAGVVEFGRNVLGLGRLVAVTTPDNDSSIRVLEKLGFRFEQTIVHPDTAERLKLFTVELGGNPDTG